MTRSPPTAMARALCCAALGLLLAGCIGQSPEQRAEADLGPEQPGVGTGPNHRPGQPCLTCHGPEHTPGEEVFVLAGTVYRRASDTRGLEGAEVEFEDAEGRSFTARTNRAGNFFVRVEQGRAEPRQRNNGELQLPWPPRFPLRVRVHGDGTQQTMRGLIWREGSCAVCHGGQPGAASNGRIYLEAHMPADAGGGQTP
ncbi:MAG: hypothetical protein OEZ06_13645 [Myxococcales bacterium]|nr:hypothetical protein [Myxococcales bacterium]